MLFGLDFFCGLTLIYIICCSSYLEIRTSVCAEN